MNWVRWYYNEKINILIPFVDVKRLIANHQSCQTKYWLGTTGLIFRWHYAISKDTTLITVTPLLFTR